MLCYDKNDGVSAASIATLFRLYGFKNVAVLNEKFQTLEEHKRSEAEQPVDVKGAGKDFVFKLNTDLVALKDDIKKIYDGAIGYIIDCRLAEDISKAGKLDTCKPHDPKAASDKIAETEDQSQLTTSRRIV